MTYPMAPLGSVVAGVTGGFRSGVGLLNRCESVAEQAFVGAFLMHTASETHPHPGHALRLVRGSDELILRGQYEITYGADPWAGGMPSDQPFARADFAFCLGDRVVLLVEVDGLRFHEASPKQAQADRARDRQLLRCGYRVARYTAPELASDALGCATEAFALALTLAAL